MRSAVQYKDMPAEGQKLLVDFLRAEVAIGFTFLQPAELASSAEHLDHAGEAMANARKAAGAVRHFLDQVTDRETRGEIEEGLARLERQMDQA